MSRTTVTASLQRATRTTDGSGGKGKAWSNVATGLTLRMRHYTAEKTVQAVDADQAPGRATVHRVLFVVDNPALGVLANDRVVVAGVAYRVLTVRVYERTLQIDAELVR